MAVMLTNNAKSRLASSIGTSDTTIAVTSGGGASFPAPASGDWFPLTLVKETGAREIVRCTARVGDVFTVERAREGTEAQSFAVGDRVELRITAEVINELSVMVGEMQPGDPRLTMLTQLELAANHLLFATGENSLALSPLTAFARTLLDDDDAAAVLQTLGLDQTGVFKTGPNGAILVPSGTDAQRPTGAAGMLRHNSAAKEIEAYLDGAWTRLLKKAVADGLQGQITDLENTVAQLPKIFTRQYISPVRTFANGDLQTFTHGLGAEPKMVQVFAVCKLAISGWEVGDVIPINMSYSGASSSTGALVKITSTQIIMRVGAHGIAALMSFASGSGAFNATGTNFNVKVKAYA